MCLLIENHACTQPIEKTKCWTNEDCPGGWCFNTGFGHKICKCNDPIVPTMDCVSGAFCKDDIECGPKGECPTFFWGAANIDK